MTILVFYRPRRLYFNLPMRFCGSERRQKGKPSLQIYEKVNKEDQKIFALNSVKGAKPDAELIERMAHNNPTSVVTPPTSTDEFKKLISGNLSDFIKRQVLKSEYQELTEKYKNSNELWTDSDFPPNQRSWGDPKMPVVWKRISDLIPNAKFVQDSFAPSDILQGKLGNCYFLSAVAGLAEKPYRIKKIFPNYEMNKNGIYMARMLHKGIYQEVVVDDYVPCTPKGELYGAQPAGQNEVWVMILEKCWAKLFGSYDAIDGGLPHQVLRAFSSAPTFNYRVTRDKEELDKLWDKILEADRHDQIICCGTQNESKTVNLTALGLVGGHAYTILGVYDSPFRMLKIRNPWGSMQWKGAASENDKKFWSKVTPQEQIQMGMNFGGDDGIFFMLWQDFEKYFIIVDICRIDDNAHYYYSTNYFEKNKPILYDISTEGGDLTLTASQSSKRELRKMNKSLEIKLASSTMILSRTDDKFSTFEYLVSKTDESYSELYLKYKDLPKGKYVLCCYVQGSDGKVDSTVSVYSPSNVSIMESAVDQVDFLHQTFLDHARNSQNGKQILCPDPLEWVVFDILTDSCGFGYTAFHLDDNSAKKLGLEFDQQQYQDNGLDLLAPFKGAGKFKLVCEKGQELIILCRLKLGQYLEQFTMPTPKMYRLK